MENYYTPILAQWDITTGCNFSCSFCLTNSGTRSKYELNSKKAKEIVDRLYDGGILFLRILGGEPFFRKDIIEIMQYAANKGMLISFSTNAALITENRANLLKEIKSTFNYFQISLYGVSPSSYADVTKNKNSFKLVRKGVENLKKYDLNPYAFWVMTSENINQIDQAYQIVKKWELPSLRISPKLNLGRGKLNIASNGDIEQYWKGAIEIFSILSSYLSKNITPSVELHARPFLGEFLYQLTGLKYFFITCKAAATMVYVDHKGNVSPCPFAEFMPNSYKDHFNGNIKMSLLSHNLHEIWESSTFKSYRKLQIPENNPKGVNKKCPHLNSGLCNPCIYTPCTCKETISIIKKALQSK